MVRFRLGRAWGVAMATLLFVVAAGAGPDPGARADEIVRSEEDVYAFGDAKFFGSTGGAHLARPVAALAATPDGDGYLEVALDGGVFSFGDADFYGSAGDIRLDAPIVGMAPSGPRKDGYWLAASDGGVFAFGNADFAGSAGDMDLPQPIVGMASTPDGGGYWLAARDGRVFAFGNADFAGSAVDIDLAAPIVGIAATPGGDGYWLVASDGGIFAFGNAAYHGSAGDIDLARPITDLEATGDGGYWMVARSVGVCLNDRWRAEYPQGWHTNSGAVAERSCAYFHPTDFELEPGTEATDIAISLRMSDTPYARASEAGGRCETVLSREETDVNGRPAVIVEFGSTGRCLLPDGVLSYRYVVDRGGDSLVAVVYEGGEPPYARSKLVLRRHHGDP